MTTCAAVPERAMLLAAGRGTRLSPYTDTVPKCMTIVDGKPTLEHAIRHLTSHGVKEVVINLHHLPDLVVDHFGDGSRFGVRIKWSLETTLLGTAGGVKQVRDRFPERFLVWYGDNISNVRLDKMAGLHVEHGADVTLALFYREKVGSSGIVGIDSTGRVHRFLEKPAPDEAFSHLVNAGIYVVEPTVLDLVPSDAPSDFGRDVFPTLLEAGRRLAGYRMGPDEYLQWIDSPEDLARATSLQTEKP